MWGFMYKDKQFFYCSQLYVAPDHTLWTQNNIVSLFEITPLRFRLIVIIIKRFSAISHNYLREAVFQEQKVTQILNFFPI
jgi:hypothetical protein